MIKTGNPLSSAHRKGTASQVAQLAMGTLLSCGRDRMRSLILAPRVSSRVAPLMEGTNERAIEVWRGHPPQIELERIQA